MEFNSTSWRQLEFKFVTFTFRDLSLKNLKMINKKITPALLRTKWQSDLKKKLFFRYLLVNRLVREKNLQHESSKEKEKKKFCCKKKKFYIAIGPNYRQNINIKYIKWIIESLDECWRKLLRKEKHKIWASFHLQIKIGKFSQIESFFVLFQGVGNWCEMGFCKFELTWA